MEVKLIGNQIPQIVIVCKVKSVIFSTAFPNQCILVKSTDILSVTHRGERKSTLEQDLQSRKTL